MAMESWAGVVEQRRFRTGDGVWDGVWDLGLRIESARRGLQERDEEAEA